MNKNYKNTFVVSLGTLLEWAEFTFFAYMVDYLSKIFFPVDNLDLARLKIYGVFAASYFMRPIGAIFFGHIGDKYGRKPPMIASLLLMSVATFAIGALPTYESFGALSSFLLIVFRMMQGFAVGGEFNGATVILTEYDKKYPFLAGSWTSFASAAGMVLGGIMATIVTKVDPMNYFGFWRLPFFLSSVLAILSIYMRKDMDETEDFRIAKENNSLFRFPIVAAWKHNRTGLLCTAVFSMFVSVYVYTGNIYYKTIAVNIGNLAQDQATLAITVGVGFNTLFIPIFAMLADKYDGYKLCEKGLLGAFFLSPLIMYSAVNGNFLYAVAGQLMYGLIDAIVSATFFTIIVKQFKTETKYSGTSFAWSVTTAIFGGTTLIVNEFLIHKTQTALSNGLYMSICALICLTIMREIERKRGG